MGVAIKSIQREVVLALLVLLIVPYMGAFIPTVRAQAQNASNKDVHVANYSSHNKVNAVVNEGHVVDFCWPIVLDLSPLKVKAKDVVAVISAGGKLIYLPSIPYPLKKVKYSIATDYLYKGKPLGTMNSRGIEKIAKELKQDNAKLGDMLKPVIASTSFYVWNYTSNKLLVLLPCNINSFSSETIPIMRNTYGMYIVNGLKVYILPKTFHESVSLESVPIPSGGVYIYKYNANSKGTPIEKVAKYQFTPEILSKGAMIVKPTSFNPAAKEPLRTSQGKESEITSLTPGSGESEEGYIWGRILWADSHSSYDNLWLGSLVEQKGITIENGVTTWSRTGEFYMPPRTVRYEIWLTLSSDTTKVIHLTIWLNNVKSVDETYTIYGGQVLAIGLSVSTGTESPGNYFDEWSKITYKVNIEGANLGGLVVKAIPLARMWIGSLNDDNLVYQWTTRAIGLSINSNNEEHYPPLLINKGEATVYLTVPGNVVEDQGDLELVVYGPEGITSSKHVSIYLGNELLCSGYTSYQYWNNAYREVYICTSSNVFNQILSSMRLGEPVQLKIVIDGVNNNEIWFADSLVLRGLARAVVATNDPVHAVSSPPINSKIYGTVVAEPSNILIYSTCYSTEPHQELVGQLVGAIYTSRPEETRIPVDTYSYVLAYVKSGVCLAGSLTELSLIKITTNMRISASDYLQVAEYWAKRLGKNNGNIDSSKEVIDSLGVLGFELAIFSSIFSGSTSTLLGIASLIASAPATFYKYDSASSSISSENPYEVIVHGEWDSGWGAPTKTGLETIANCLPSSSGWSSGITIDANSYVYIYEVVHDIYDDSFVIQPLLDANIFSPLIES